VWGRDEDGFQFKQHDIDKLLSTVDHRGLRATFTINLYPMRSVHMQGLLNLCVSDRSKVKMKENKRLLSF